MEKAVAIIKKISEIAKKNGISRPFLVGGAVRNMIVGRDPVDFDITCGDKNNLILADLVASHFNVPVYETAIGAKKMTIDGVDFDFGPHVVNIQANDSMTAELLSRDFTINTIMISCDTGEIVDKFNALEDLKNKKLKCTVSQGLTFKDPKRLLRAIKFIAHGFLPDAETEKFICKDFHRIQKINSRLAAKFINNAIRDNPDILDWLKKRDLIKYIPMTKLVINHLAKRRMLNDV